MGRGEQRAVNEEGRVLLAFTNHDLCVSPSCRAGALRLRF
jgi:hypothetical protein